MHAPSNHAPRSSISVDVIPALQEVGEPVHVSEVVCIVAAAFFVHVETEPGWTRAQHTRTVTIVSRRTVTPYRVTPNRKVRVATAGGGGQRGKEARVVGGYFYPSSPSKCKLNGVSGLCASKKAGT